MKAASIPIYYTPPFPSRFLISYSRNSFICTPDLGTESDDLLSARF